LIRLTSEQAGNGFVERLQDVLEPYREGRCPVTIEYQRPDSASRLNFGSQWKVRPADELLNKLVKLTAKDCIELEY
jgi:DNA polymerase-3 subunit alpha